MNAVLVPTAAATPATATIRVRRFAMLLESEELAAIDPLRAVVAVELDQHRHRVLSATALVAHQREDATPFMIRSSRSGTVHGVLTWCSSDDGTSAQTAEPYEDHGRQSFHRLPDPYALEAGMALTIVLDEAGRATVSPPTTRSPADAPERNGDRHHRP